MINKMLKEAGSDEEGSDDDSADSDASSDSEDKPHQIKMRFDSKSKKAAMKGDKKTEKGIMGLKFMERAQQKEKEALKAEVNLAVK
mmetsp:Transcript_23845/g.31934  ORF Transcript_23845/g.31934 Transcript_23845/m.31934 type:complete len:86 (-) Transcript_23845:1075-1332(-)